jgi:hypothetical protein
MKSTSTQTKVFGAVFALLMSATVLGATVAGMQSGGSRSSDVVTLDRLVVSAPAQSAVN